MMLVFLFLQSPGFEWLSTRATLKSPPVAVVWPKQTDFLPAIAVLVPLSTTITALASFALVSSMVNAGWRHSRNETELLTLV